MNGGCGWLMASAAKSTFSERGCTYSDRDTIGVELKTRMLDGRGYQLSCCCRCRDGQALLLSLKRWASDTLVSLLIFLVYF